MGGMQPGWHVCEQRGPQGGMQLIQPLCSGMGTHTIPRPWDLSCPLSLGCSWLRALPLAMSASAFKVRILEQPPNARVTMTERSLK